MKKIMKKALALALALVMVIALAPMNTKAEEQTVSVASGSEAIEQYGWKEVNFKAPGNGVIKVSLAGTPGWNYMFANDTTSYWGEWIYSDFENGNNLTYEVSAGDVCAIGIYGYDPATGDDMAAANIIYDIQFIGEVVEGATDPTGATPYDALPVEFDGNVAYATAAAQSMTYFKVTVDSTKDYTVTMQDRFGSTYSLYYYHPYGWEMWVADSEFGAVTTTIEAGASEYIFGVYTESTMDLSLMITVTEGIVAAEKVELVEGENSVDVTVENYYCEGTEATFTATEAGTYTISAADGETNADLGLIDEYGIEWITLPYDVTLEAGESVDLLVCTSAYMTLTEDTIDLVIAPKVEEETPVVSGTGTEEDPYTMIIGDNTAEVSTDAYKYFVYEATEAGALYITMSSENESWFYSGYVNSYDVIDQFTNPNKTWVTTDNSSTDADPVSLRTIYVEAGDKVLFRVSTARDASWTRPAGTVVFNAWFAAGEGGSGDVVLEEYVVSDVMLSLGDNVLELDPSAYTTVYEFCPDEEGTYKFETSEGYLLGYWGGGSFFVWDQTENKTNTLSHEITAVGQSIMLGVTGEGTCTVTITKEGEYVDPTLYLDWENLWLEDVKDFELAEDAELVYIDVTDGKDEVTYLGEDGYIHLNSETGPIVYCQVGYDSPYVSLPMLLGYQGIATSYVEEETGTPVVLDFTNAAIEYVGTYDGNGNYTAPLIESVNGFVPLTIDLMLIIMAAAEGQLWFEPEMNNYYFEEGTVFDSEPWLFICAYEVDPENDPYAPEEDATVGGMVHHVNAYDWTATSVYAFASSDTSQNVNTMTGQTDGTFEYWTYVELDQNEDGNYVVSAIYPPTADNAGDSVALETGKVVIMVHDACADTDSYAFFTSLEVGTVLSADATWDEMAATWGAMDVTFTVVEDDDNTDDGNTGDDNTGDDNTGDDNTDDGNTGDDNTDDGNTGDDNTDDGNIGDDTIKNTGDATVTFITMILFLGAALVLAGFATKKKVA